MLTVSVTDELAFGLISLVTGLAVGFLGLYYEW